MDRASASQARRKIVVFLILTLLFSSVFYALILNAGSLSAGGLNYVTALMWCPALAAVATRRLFGDSIATLPGVLGKPRFLAFAYLAPLVYGLAAYVPIWFSGLGGFLNEAFVAAQAKAYGWSELPAPLVLIGYIAITVTAGLIPGLARAFGEELGWRGFLVPELAKVTGFHGTALISGVVWATWHYPVLIFGDYNNGTPAWFGLSCFTAMVIAMSYVMAWLRLRSGSVWACALLHASHNTFVQQIFTPLTTDTGSTAWFIDEFGIGLAIMLAIAAAVVVARTGRRPYGAPLAVGAVSPDG
jgi:uncharacterized protein